MRCTATCRREMYAVHRHVQAARKAGARVVLGGEMPPSKALGTFYPPTVLADVPHTAKEVGQEEECSRTYSLSSTAGRAVVIDACAYARAPGDPGGGVITR